MLNYTRRFLDERTVRRRWLDPRLAEVRVADIRAYLLSKGWKPVPPDRTGVLAFEEPVVDEDGPLYQWIPENEQSRDYPAHVYELLAVLAEIEDRSAVKVLTDLLGQRHGDSQNGIPADRPHPAGVTG